MQKVQKPLSKHPWRRLLGREYYIVVRKIHDLIHPLHWARKRQGEAKYTILSHRTLILRPLKGVDMYLQENKRTNLKLAIAHLDGLSIAPGETFSIWRYVGRPSRRKGYLDGLVLNQGSVTKGVGGGLCQLGNLLFGMFAHTPLRITERHRHCFDVFPDTNRTLPFGSGATLSYNYIDLRVYNPTDTTFYLDLWLDSTHLNGQISSDHPLREAYEVREEGHVITMQDWGGYTRHNRLLRHITAADGSEREEPLVENYAIMMYNPLLHPAQKSNDS